VNEPGRFFEGRHLSPRLPVFSNRIATTSRGLPVERGSLARLSERNEARALAADESPFVRSSWSNRPRRQLRSRELGRPPMAMRSSSTPTMLGISGGRRKRAVICGGDDVVSDSPLVQAIQERLRGGGYRDLSTPFKAAGFEFSFTGAMRGRYGRALDMVSNLMIASACSCRSRFPCAEVLNRISKRTVAERSWKSW
jgi:hypothetical protein